MAGLRNVEFVHRRKVFHKYYWTDFSTHIIAPERRAFTGDVRPKPVPESVLYCPQSYPIYLRPQPSSKFGLSAHHGSDQEKLQHQCSKYTIMMLENRHQKVVLICFPFQV